MDNVTEEQNFILVYLLRTGSFAIKEPNMNRKWYSVFRKFLSIFSVVCVCDFLVVNFLKSDHMFFVSI